MVEAYEAGAGDVFIHWVDDECQRIRYTYTKLDRFKETEKWYEAYYNDLSEKDAAFLIIASNDPENLKDVDPEKISTYNNAYTKTLAAYYERMLNNKVAWCIAAMPTPPSWAKKVFPKDDVDVAMSKLMDKILEASRANEDDPVKAWHDHQEKIDGWLDFLNSGKFKSLRYKNSLGTDFTVELAENHIWYGGADTHYHKAISSLPIYQLKKSILHQVDLASMVKLLPANPPLLLADS